MLLIDSLLRFPTIIGLLFCAILLLRDHDWTLPTIIGALLAISLSALFLDDAPAALSLPPKLGAVANIISIPNLALLWWFARALLDDNFKLGALEWVGFLLLSIGNMPFLYRPSMGGLNLIFNALTLAVPIHLAFLIVTGWRNDLIQQRRQFRLLLLCWVFVGIFIILIMEDANSSSNIKSLVRVALTFPPVWLVILVSTRMHTTANIAAPKRQIWNTSPIGEAHFPALKRLMGVIESDKIYLDATLTISVLSKKCGVSEYQMRNLINGHLGSTNFSTFINSYRINEAKVRLMQSPEPITSVALDCGFQTLSTFNRAFRKIEGLTPSEFRLQHSK